MEVVERASRARLELVAWGGESEAALRAAGAFIASGLALYAPTALQSRSDRSVGVATISKSSPGGPDFQGRAVTLKIEAVTDEIVHRHGV
jgi:hypothetical protein